MRNQPLAPFRRVGIALTILLSLQGCAEQTGTSNGSGGGSFECKGACVDGIGLSMPNGHRYVGPLPTPTTTGAEPVITGAEWIAAGGNRLLLVVTTEPGVPFDQIYFEINGQVFLIDSVESVADVAAFDLCTNLVTSSGFGCSDACLEASQCVHCPDPWLEKALQGSLASNCSIFSHDTPFGPGETWESESQFMNEQLTSFIGSAAVIDLYQACDAEICESSAASSKNLRTFEFTYDYSSLMFEPMLVVPSDAASASPAMSSPFAVGDLGGTTCCPPNGLCTIPCQ